MGRVVVTCHLNDMLGAEVLVVVQRVMAFHLQTHGVHKDVMHALVENWDELPRRLLQVSSFVNLMPATGTLGRSTI